MSSSSPLAPNTPSSKDSISVITPPTPPSSKMAPQLQVKTTGSGLDAKLSPLSVPHMKVKNIACIGAGYVGGPTCSVLAYKNPDVNVTVADLDVSRINAWNSSSLPIYEPGLYEIVSVARDGVDTEYSTDSTQRFAFSSDDDSSDGDRSDDHDLAKPAGRRPNLKFTTDVEGAVRDADIIFVTVNTPAKTQGIGKGVASDLGYLDAATRTIAKAATRNKIIVEKSTVPCRTAEAMKDILAANGRPGVRFDILSNPEFLAEGSAIPDLLCPDRILIGSLATMAGYRAVASLAEVYSAWVPVDRIITMNLWSAELSKLAANALLAQRVSSINSLSAICEVTGADIDEVAYACGLDDRIGPRMLKAGPGFGGSCLRKDILSLVYLAETLHLFEVAAYWRAVVDINEYQKDRFTKRIVSCLFNTVAGKKIAILGFSYKEDTGDTRESAAIKLVTSFAAEMADVTIFDPAAKASHIWDELAQSGLNVGGVSGRVTICKTAYEACHKADAVIIPTAWAYFSNKISLAHSTPVHTPAPGELDPDRVGVSQLTSSASSVSIGSLSGKLEKALLVGPSSANIAADKEAINPHTSPQLGEAQAPGEEGDPERLDWAEVAKLMKKPMYVFDARNILDAEKLEKLGFRVEAIGKSSTALKGMSDF